MPQRQPGRRKVGALHPRRRHGAGDQCSGAIAQSLAETMAGCGADPARAPGRSQVSSAISCLPWRLKSGSPTFGTPEPAIGSMVVGQLARRLNLPLRCSGNIHHLQAARCPGDDEGTMSMLAAIHCGANFIPAFGGLPRTGSCRCSYEKFRAGLRSVRRAAHLS